MSDIKTYLKDAKEAIDNKDFKRAAEICQEAYDNIDNKNYNINLFLGLSYCNIDNYNLSEKYYLSAIKIQPTSPFPIRGLVELYGKSKENEKLIENIKILIPLTTDSSKKKELQKKLLDTLELCSKFKEAEVILSELVQEISNNDDRESIGERIRLLSRLEMIKESGRLLEIKLISEQKMKDKGIPILNPAKSHVIGALQHTPEQKKQKEQIDLETEELVMSQYSLQVYNDILNLEHQLLLEFLSIETIERIYQNFIKNIQIKRRFSKDLKEFLKYKQMIYRECIKMKDLLKTSYYPLEILIEQYEENRLEQQQDSKEELYEISNKLVELNRPLGWIGLGYHLIINQQDYSENSKVILTKGLTQLPSSMIGNEALVKYLYKVQLNTNPLETLETIKSIHIKLQPTFQYKERQISINPIGPFYSDCQISIEILLVNSYVKNFDFEQGIKILNSLVAQDQYKQYQILLYTLGKIYFKLSNFEKSIENFNLIIKNPTNNNNHIQRKSKIYKSWIHSILNENLQESMEIIKDLSKNGEEEGYLELFIQGLIEKKRGNLKESLQYFLKSAKLNSNFSETFSNLGDLYRDTDIERSKKCYQRAISLNPMNKDAGIALSEIYLKNLQISLAVSLYKEITDSCLSNRKQFPVNVVTCNWAFYRLALHQMDNSKLDDSVNSFLNAIKGSPNDSLYWRGLGEAYHRQNKYIASLKTLKKAEELISAPTPELHYQIASLSMILGEHEDAIQEFNMVLKNIKNHIPSLKSKSESLFHLVKDLFSQKSYRMSLDYLIEAEESISLAIKESIERKIEVESLYKILGDESSYYINFGTSSKFNLLDKLNQASDSYLKVFELSSKSQISTAGYNTTLVYSLQDLSIIYYLKYCYINDQEKENNYKTSIKFITQALNTEPNDDRLWNLMGVILMDKYPAQSQHALVKAIRIDSSKPDTFNNLALLYLRYGFTEMADRSLIIAKSNDSSSIRSWTIQGLIHEFESSSNNAFNDYSHCSIALESNPIGEGLLGYGISSYFKDSSSLETTYSILYKYLELFPNSIEANLYFSFVLENLLNFKESENYLIKTLSLLNNDNSNNSNSKVNNEKPSISNFKSNSNIISSSNQINNINNQDKIQFVLISLSKIQLKLGKFNESIETLKSIKIEKSTSPSLQSMVYEYFGNNYYFINKLEESINSLKKSIELTTNESRKSNLSLQLAKVYYASKQSKLDANTVSIIEGLVSKQQNEEAVCFLACVYIVLKSFDKAIKVLESHQLSTNLPTIKTLKLLSQVSTLSGKFSNARSYLQRACHLYPHNSEPWILLAQLQVNHFSNENYDNLPATLMLSHTTLSSEPEELNSTIKNHVTASLKQSKLESNAIYQLANSYLSGVWSPFNSSIQKSINLFKRLVHFEPSNMYYMYCLMNTYYIKALYSGSQEDFQQTKLCKDILDHYSSQGSLKLDENEFKWNTQLISLDLLISERNESQYKSTFAELIKLYANDKKKLSTLHANQGKFYLTLDDTSNALVSYKESIKLDNSRVQSYYELSLVYEKIELLDASLLCLQKSIEFVGDSVSLQLNSVSRIVRLQIQMKKYKDAIKTLDSISALSDNTLLLILRGIILIQSNVNYNPNAIKQYTNDMKLCIQLITDAIGKNPNINLSNYYLCLANINLKSYKNLESILQKELLLSPQLEKEINQLIEKCKTNNLNK